MWHRDAVNITTAQLQTMSEFMFYTGSYPTHTVLRGLQ